jgi:hypothetical protein
MGMAGTVATPETTTRFSRQRSRYPAFILLLLIRSTYRCVKPESMAAKKIIDMPSWRGDAVSINPDMPGDPVQTPRTMCRPAIDIPALRKMDNPKGTYPCAGSFGKQDKTVRSLIHSHS